MHRIYLVFPETHSNVLTVHIGDYNSRLVIVFASILFVQPRSGVWCAHAFVSSLTKILCDAVLQGLLLIEAECQLHEIIIRCGAWMYRVKPNKICTSAVAVGA